MKYELYLFGFLSDRAALVFEQVNYQTLAESAEISAPTAKEWLKKAPKIK